MSKTDIERKLRRKKNPILVKTIIQGKKKEGWVRVADLASLPRRKKIEKNLDEIDKATKEGDTIVVAGKVLGKGKIDKKIRVCAFSFSEEALRKLKEKKCEIAFLREEIEKNPSARGVKIL